jgi:hypothetical protein
MYHEMGCERKLLKRGFEDHGSSIAIDYVSTYAGAKAMNDAILYACLDTVCISRPLEHHTDHIQ